MGLTNYDLDAIARKLHIPLNDILCKDQLHGHARNGGYIFNMEDDVDSNGQIKDGTHWICCYIEGKHAGYFDSFGFQPPIEIQRFLKRFTPYPWSEQHIQNIRSEECGWYCIYFIWFMYTHRHIPFMKRYHLFLDLWDDDPSKNEKLLKKYLQI